MALPINIKDLLKIRRLSSTEIIYTNKSLLKYGTYNR